MANRFSVAAFVVFACLLLAPFAAQARSGGGGGGGGGHAVGGGFRGAPAGHIRAAPARVNHGPAGSRFGKPGFVNPGFGKPGFVGHGFGRHGFARHGFGRLGFDGRRLAYRYGYGGYGAYLDDTFLGGTAAPYAVPYPVSGIAPAAGDPPDMTGGIGGPLVLRHICQSEVQVVPATRGGDHEVTVTRCRLYAQ